MNNPDTQSPATANDSLGVPAHGQTLPVSRESTAASTGVERLLLRKLNAQLGNPPIRYELWDGMRVPVSDVPGGWRLRILDRRTLWQLLVNPELNFGDAYTRGTLEIEGDLVGVLEAIDLAILRSSRGNPLLDALRHVLNRTRPNTQAGSRSNIPHHYNLGNDFFRLWLDEELVYTCAYFPTDTLSLEQAQRAKMDLVCRKLRLQPGERIIEAGCGWGALARYMARHYGVRVRAFNLSSEQIRYARERALAEGLNRQIEYIEDDYRNIDGRCDAFVSVGMLEHVGHRNYRTLGAIIDRCLAPGGRGLIHTIARDRPARMNAWIEKRIFPGAYPPSLREMLEVLEPWGFSVLDVENLRLHYARTLGHWLARFEAHRDEVREHFDASFVRAWRLYLAGSLASFSTGWLQLFQVVFARTGANEIPWTREHLYDDRT